MRAVCIGECMVELREAGGDLLSKAFAGDAYNAAVYLKRSAPDLQVQFLSVTGADPLSRSMREAWCAEGVEDDLAFTDAERTPGLYLIELDDHGERKFHYWRAVSAARQWMHRLRSGGGDPLEGADLVYLSGISLAILPDEEREQALLMLRSLHGRVGKIAFDPNIRPALWPGLSTARVVIEAAIGLADIVLPSTDDLGLIYGEASPETLAARLWKLHAREIALTAGPRGCLVTTAQGRSWTPAPEAAVVDTSGAGDAFNGGYLAARLAGAEPPEAAEAGLAVAARVVTAPGAIVPASVSHPKEP